MERLIRQLLQTVAKLGQSDQAALLLIQSTETGLFLAGLFDEKITFPKKIISLKNTPIETFLKKNARIESYPCCLVDHYPFPCEDNGKVALQCLCLPLYNTAGRLQAVLLLARAGHDITTFYQLHIFERLQNLFAATLETALENATLAKQTTVDSLTGLHSHTYFEKRLQEEFARCQRHGCTVSLLLIDIDHFQDLVIKYGAQNSRLVLLAVARVVMGAIRQEIDIPCRYNHSQVALLLPNTPIDGSFIVAERIRKRCEMLELPLASHGKIKITVSIGAAHNIEEFHDEDTQSELDNVMQNETPFAELNQEQLSEVIESAEITKEDILYRAEVMLAAANQAGFNRTMVWW
jgi:two-component system, cell cycle response regulator